MEGKGHYMEGDQLGRNYPACPGNAWLSRGNLVVTTHTHTHTPQIFRFCLNCLMSPAVCLSSCFPPPDLSWPLTLTASLLFHVSLAPLSQHVLWSLCF